MDDAELIAALGWEPCRLDRERQRCTTHYPPGAWIHFGTCRVMDERLSCARAGIDLARVDIADAAEPLLDRAFDIAYTYTCETGSTEDNERMQPGAFEMRHGGHLDARLLAAQIAREEWTP